MLIFNVDELIKQIKSDDFIIREITKSYKHKVPNFKDSTPHFNEYYKKILLKQALPSMHDMNTDEEGEPISLGLPSPILRATLLNGTETDRRHEFEEVVGNFPKIDLQK